MLSCPHQPIIIEAINQNNCVVLWLYLHSGWQGGHCLQNNEIKSNTTMLQLLFRNQFLEIIYRHQTHHHTIHHTLFITLKKGVNQVNQNENAVQNPNEWMNDPPILLHTYLLRLPDQMWNVRPFLFWLLDLPCMIISVVTASDPVVTHLSLLPAWRGYF